MFQRFTLLEFEMSYRLHQAQVAASYNGPYNTHASHYISDREMGHFGVSRSAGNHESNYRNCNAFTNQSQHNRIDNTLMQAHQSRSGSVGGFSYQHEGNGCYVSRQDMVDRVSHKIEVAKASGAIDNARMYNYLHKSADRLNMDMRIFNGYN